MTLDTRYLFSTETLIEPGLQRRLIQAVRRTGELSSGSFSIVQPPYWLWQTLTLPEPDSVPAVVRERLSRRPPQDFDRWAYFSRLDPGLEWSWRPGEASELAQEALRPLRGLFRKLTRVKVDLQLPGRALPAHRDLVPGSRYETLRTEYSDAWGDQSLTYKALPWLWEEAPPRNLPHGDNRYLSLKLPLSEDPRDPGRPYVIIGATRHFYSSENRAFFLNEAEMFHGALPAAHWRGVVFVNGLWDLDALERLPKRPVTVLASEPC